MCFTGAATFYWGVMDIEHRKEDLLSQPKLYEKGMKGKLFSTTVFWLWNIYACYQALVVLFIGMTATQNQPLSNGKNFTFWAGGHVVYF